MQIYHNGFPREKGLWPTVVWQGATSEAAPLPTVIIQEVNSPPVGRPTDPMLSSPGGGKLSPEALSARICFSMGIPTTQGMQSKSFRKYRHLGVFVLFRNSTKERVFSIQLRASGNHIILFLSISFSLNWVWIAQEDTILVDFFLYFVEYNKLNVWEELFHYYHRH